MREIQDNLKLLRKPELVKLRDFIATQTDFPPQKAKFVREFMSFAPDKNGGDTYKTHIFTTLLTICDQIEGASKSNFVSLIESVQPDESQIIARIDNKEIENRNKEKENSEYQKRLEAIRKKEREKIAEEGINSETNNPLAQARKEAAERAKKEAEARATEAVRREAERKEAEARATEAVRREAERKEAEARAKKQAEERAKKEAEAMAKKEAEARAKKEAEARVRREAEARAREALKREAEERARKEATERAIKEVKKNAQRARSLDGSLKHPLRNPPKPPTQRFVPPYRSNRSQRKPENLTDFEVFKQYYEGFCNIYNHTILDDQSLKSNFELFNLKQYQKFKTKNGSLQEDNNRINDVEFEKFLKHQNCLVDDKDPLFLAIRECRLFDEFKKNFNLLNSDGNYKKITGNELRETFDSFRSGEFKISYKDVKQYEKEVVDDYLNGLGSSYNNYKSEEHERIYSDKIFIAYQAIHTRYLSENLTSKDSFAKSSSQSQTSNEDHWQNILLSIDKAKSHLSKLSEEFKGINLAELPQFTLPKIQLPESNQESNSHITSGFNKVQDIVKFFESLSNQNKAPISYPVQSFQPISRANSWSPKNKDGAINKPSDKVREPRGQNIAYFGPRAKELEEKHKKAMERNGKSL